MPNSSNHHRHKKSDSLYAHFSSVDEFNTELYPNLKLTNPIYFKLEKGQSIYIPKGWWHWIKSTTKSFAVNYWFSNINKLDPFIFEYEFGRNKKLRWRENLKENKLILFPSYLKHFIPKNISDEAMVALSFQFQLL